MCFLFPMHQKYIIKNVIWVQDWATVRISATKNHTKVQKELKVYINQRIGNLCFI